MICLASFAYAIASRDINAACLDFPPWHTEFLLLHKLHAMIANNAQSSSGFLSLISHTISIKSVGMVSKYGSFSLVFPHTSPANLHPHKACPDVSQLPHSSHLSSRPTPLGLNWYFVGSMFKHTFHIKCFTLLGHSKLQINFHNVCIPTLFEPSTHSSL